MRSAGDNAAQASHTLSRHALAGAVFVATAWFPPGPAFGDPKASGTLARMHPGVPASRIVLRSACLGLSALSLALWDRASGDSVLLWSPSLEADLGLRENLCREQSDLRAFSVRDRSGISEILAAVSATQTWTPPLPERRRTPLSCTPLDRGRAEAPRTDDLEHTLPCR